MPTRPAQFRAEDLSEMLGEVIPRLLTDQSAPEEGETLVSPREPAFKRAASSTPGGETEVLFCEATMASFRQSYPAASEVEVLLAGFLHKKRQKEIPVVGNPSELQERVEEAKGVEWCTMQSKPSVKVWTGADAERIRRERPDRLIGSRFVVTEKVEEEGSRIKARWCLQGHLDPDVEAKVLSGACHSPTMSHLSRSLLLQLLVSKRWRLCLGDVKGAFLEAGPLKKQYQPLYAKQPAGGIPGVDADDVIEVIGNVYGLNDAPFWWYEAFDKEVRGLGFERSQFDSCVYYLRDPSSQELVGVLGAHVDDSLTGGAGPFYEATVAKLRARFPYRKWRVGSGEFCGVYYSQCPESFEITYQQKEYSQHVKPIPMSRERAAQKDSPATAREISALRALNGATNWLANQSRPDLAVQVSMSQQAFPTSSRPLVCQSVGAQSQASPGS